jgi:hypothetical protein
MSNIILELAAKAGYDSQYSSDDFSPEEFAELIVKECIQGLKERIATRYQGSEKDRDIAYGMEIVYLDIVDKFGVEE